MDATNLQWKQIKELADKAVELGADFTLKMSKDSVEIEIINPKQNRHAAPIYGTQTNPNTPLTSVTLQG